MDTLHPNWITEKNTDFEYKKYVLLGFLKRVSNEFEAQRLFPGLTCLETEHDKLLNLKIAINSLKQQFTKRIINIDLQQLKINYESTDGEHKTVEEVEQIVDFSIPLLERMIEKGRNELLRLEQAMNISPVGITPLMKQEGYLLLFTKKEKQIDVFSYKVSLFDHVQTSYPALKTTFVKSFENSLTQTFERIKLSLINSNIGMPNPATFLVSTALSLPVNFTFLAVAKLKLSKFIN
jgi:hypothetical protein